jgi:hypothetical protein
VAEILRETDALPHVISRVVDRRFVLGTEEKSKLRALMRMQENFTGCRVLSYCLMDNHFHLLLEVPSMAEGGISDDELLKPLSAIYGEDFVAGVALELAYARKAVYTQAREAWTRRLRRSTSVSPAACII